MAARGMTALLIAFLALAGYTLAFGAACHALLHKRDSQAALAWVAFIVLVPYVGTVAYLLAVSYTHLTLPTTSRV